MIPALADFLAVHGWPADRVTPFPADWSARRYARAQRSAPPYSAIVMQAPPDADFHHFIHIARLLRGIGAAAPEIYAIDNAQGLLLLEDFGDGNFGRLIDGGADPEPLLRRAIDALCFVQRRTQAIDDPALPRFDSARFIAQLDPVLDNFSFDDPEQAARAWRDAWRKALAPCAALPQALLLRDFIADNLMTLPERADGQTVGLLDFELAGLGPLAYDVASLTEQIRRDLPETLRQSLHAYYLTQWPELDSRHFHTCLRVLSAQRHARTFARLRRMQRPDFYIRCHAFLRSQLAHEDCAPLRAWFTAYMPEYFA